MQTHARRRRRRRRRARRPRRRRRRRGRATRDAQLPRRRRTFRRRPRAASRFVNGQTCFSYHLSIRSFRRCARVRLAAVRGESAATDAAARIFALCARFSSRRVSAWRSRPPRWRRARARLAERRARRATPRRRRRAGTASRAATPRAATVEELRTRVTAVWPRGAASSPRVPRFFSASRRADARGLPRGGIGADSTPREETVGRVCGEVARRRSPRRRRSAV